MDNIYGFNGYEDIVQERQNIPVIEILNMEKGDVLKDKSLFNQILFIRKGRCEITSDFYNKRELKDNQALFIPITCQFELKSLDKMNALIVRFTSQLNLQDNFTVDQLVNATISNEYKLGQLDVNPNLKLFLDNLRFCLEDGINSKVYFEAKITELFQLLNHYYTVEALASFFSNILSKNVEFAEFVYANWEKLKSVKEMAAMYKYSESGFTKKFKYTFGVSPHKWLTEKKTERLYHELTSGTKSVKELSIEYRFNSVQQFTNFCKKNLGISPGALKKHKI